jgi:transposase
MISRGDLTDAEQAMLEPLLPSTNNRCGRWRDHRQVINGILHRLSTGAQWRELPERFGPWKTVHKRHLLWSADGTWEMLLQHVQASGRRRGRHRLGHQRRFHLCPRPPPRRWGAQGGTARTARFFGKEGSAKISSRSRGRRVRGPPGGGGAAAEALGRSPGGLTCKIHLSAEGHYRPLSLLITPGQRADCTQFEPVMDKIRVPRLGLGRPRRTPNSVRRTPLFRLSRCHSPPP